MIIYMAILLLLIQSILMEVYGGEWHTNKGYIILSGSKDICLTVGRLRDSDDPKETHDLGGDEYNVFWVYHNGHADRCGLWGGGRYSYCLLDWDPILEEGEGRPCLEWDSSWGGSNQVGEYEHNLKLDMNDHTGDKLDWNLIKAEDPGAILYYGGTNDCNHPGKLCCDCRVEWAGAKQEYILELWRGKSLYPIVWGHEAKVDCSKSEKKCYPLNPFDPFSWALNKVACVDVCPQNYGDKVYKDYVSRKYYK